MGEEPFLAASDFPGCLAFGTATLDVALSFLVPSPTNEHRTMESMVKLAVTTPVEPVASCPARGCWNRLQTGNAVKYGFDLQRFSPRSEGSSKCVDEMFFEISLFFQVDHAFQFPTPELLRTPE